jgi:hypothetical protein
MYIKWYLESESMSINIVYGYAYYKEISQLCDDT